MDVKSGDELFAQGNQSIGKSLLDFWRWSSSDILGNALRGKLAEYLVAVDLGVDSGVRYEWDAYDLKTLDGTSVEVKSSAYLQSWEQNKLSAIQFGIQPTFGWDASTNTVSDTQKRQAQVYVFCVLSHQDADSVNPMNLEQWDFYVLATEVLDRELGSQKTLALSSLQALNPTQCKFGSINTSIHKALQRPSG